jgi:hypothetical protein
MNAQEMISEFLSSEHGAQAVQALGAQGVSEFEAQQLLAQAAGAAHEHVQEQSAGLMGDHPGKSFFSAFAAGLVRGDGLFKSLFDGGEGMVSGRIAESLARKAGLDSSTASTIAAAATPYIVGFLKQKMA